MAEDAKELTLRYADGRERLTPLMPADFHTKKLNFLGTEFERQKDGSYLEVAGGNASAPKKSVARSKLTRGRGGK